MNIEPIGCFNCRHAVIEGGERPKHTPGMHYNAGCSVRLKGVSSILMTEDQGEHVPVCEDWRRYESAR